MYFVNTAIKIHSTNYHLLTTKTVVEIRKPGLGGLYVNVCKHIYERANHQYLKVNLVDRKESFVDLKSLILLKQLQQTETYHLFRKEVKKSIDIDRRFH